MTKKDGLADQINYTLKAATAVADQHGTVPPLVGEVEASLSAPPPVSSPVVSAPPTVEAAPTSAPPAPVAPVAPGAPTVANPTVSTPVTAPTGSTALVVPASSAAASPAAIFSGKTVASSSGLAGSALPSVLAIGLGGIFIASGLRFRIGRTP